MVIEHMARPPIKITGVKTTRLTHKPTDGSYVHECGPVVLTKVDVGIVEVFTDQGITGIDSGHVNDPSDHAELIGTNPFDVLLSHLPAGLDVACWDIIGQVIGQPVYRLLAIDNVPNPTVRVYASSGVMWTFYDQGSGQPYGSDALIEEALRYKAMGFDTFKWRPGTDLGGSWHHACRSG